MGNGCEAVFQINEEGGTVTLRENYGFSKKNLTRIHATLQVRQAQTLEHWRLIHGPD